MLKDYIEKRLWGGIEVKFEDGKITHVRKYENIKP